MQSSIFLSQSDTHFTQAATGTAGVSLEAPREKICWYTDVLLLTGQFAAALAAPGGLLVGAVGRILFYGNRTSPRVTYIIAVFRHQLIITKAHGDQIPEIGVAPLPLDRAEERRVIFCDCSPPRSDVQ
jgi:hypothetical protein